MHQLLERVSRAEHVVAAGAIYLRPLELGPIGQEAPVVLDGQVDTPAVRRANPTLNHQVAGVGYFEAMRTPVLQGRTFTDADTATARPVVIVGQRAASRLWPNRTALGQRLLLPTSGETAPTWRTVVGVVADVHYRGLGDVRLDVYQPALQAETTARYVVVRTRAAPLQGAALVRAEAARLDGSVVVDSVLTLASAVERARAPWRFATSVLGAFALAGLALAGLALFSVVALDVTGRRRELAIRMALGARPGAVMRLLLEPVAGLAGLGLVFGALAAAGATRIARALLFGVAGTDPWTWGMVVGLVVGTAVVGTYLPARMVLGTSPASLLRDQ
jgi:predicted lysophospholipase L1 biosynthesis ABC-type transport system permease subunit